MKPFEELLAYSAEAHGHLCPGQVVGVRMAMLGCRLIGLDEPTNRDQVKKLIVYQVGMNKVFYVLTGTCYMISFYLLQIANFVI